VISGIQFTKHFIEFVVGETNQLFGGNSNVNLTRQICGQRSGMAAGTPRPSGSILLFRTNLLYVPNIEMYRMVGSRSVHDFRTCKENAAAQCRLPIFLTCLATRSSSSSEFATAQRDSFCKSRSHAQT